MDQVSKAEEFKLLHKKGTPVIIYNAWDAGSARAIVESGARAVATGDHPVGFSHGFTNDDFDEFTFETYLVTIKEIAKRVDIPFSVDISNGKGLDERSIQDRIKVLLDAGIIGINFEDRSDNGGVVPEQEHAKRIAIIRRTASEYGVPLFINARTDIFAEAGDTNHESLMDDAISRATAYKDAGANSFFVPGLMDIDLIKKLCEVVNLPINIIRLPGAPEARELIDAGVSRISYGPVVQMEMIEWLKGKAKEALNP